MNIATLIGFLIFFVAIYFIFGLLLYFTQTFFLFHGKKLAADYKFNFSNYKVEEYNIKRIDNTNLSFIKVLPTTNNKKGIVLYFHGNLGNVIRFVPYSKIFIDKGYEVWIMDYPGYGKSTGKITEKTMTNDAQIIYDLAQKKICFDSIIIYGKSMGTGAATYIASNNNCKRVILETPYFSLPSVYDDFTFIYPTKLMLKFQFPNYKYIPQIKAPITIFHGTKDNLIRYKNASKLKAFLKPNDEFVTVQNATHTNILSYSIYTTKMDSLLITNS